MYLNIEQYSYKLRFKLDIDAPLKYRDKWNLLADEIQGGEGNNKNIITNYCKKNGYLPLKYLSRSEGGFYIGQTDSNQTSLQMRFRDHFFKQKYDDILIENITGNWTYSQLNLVIATFCEMLDELMKTQGAITGVIEMEPRDSYDDILEKTVCF